MNNDEEDTYGTMGNIIICQKNVVYIPILHHRLRALLESITKLYMFCFYMLTLLFGNSVPTVVY